MSLNAGLTLEEADEVGKVLSRYDRDGSGTMDEKEFCSMVSDLGHTLSPEEQEKAMLLLDTNSDGQIQLSEFRYKTDMPVVVHCCWCWC